MLGIQLVYGAAETVWAGAYLSASRIAMTLAAVVVIPCCFSREGKGKTVLFGISQMALMLLADLIYSRSLTVLLGENILNELLLHPVLLTAIKLLYALFLLLLNFGFCSIWSRLVSHGEAGWDAPFLLFILGQCVSIIMLDYFIWTLTPEMPLTLSLLCLLCWWLCFWCRAWCCSACLPRRRSITVPRSVSGCWSVSWTCGVPGRVSWRPTPDRSASWVTSSEASWRQRGSPSLRETFPVLSGAFGPCVQTAEGGAGHLLRTSGHRRRDGRQGQTM